jgi:hypothetical protein
MASGARKAPHVTSSGSTPGRCNAGGSRRFLATSSALHSGEAAALDVQEIRGSSAAMIAFEWAIVRHGIAPREGAKGSVVRVSSALRVVRLMSESMGMSHV